MLQPRYVDSREQKRRAALIRHGFESKMLDSGDITFPEFSGEFVLIEHKGVTQLLDDMVTGQLIQQMRRVCESSRFPILMIEGRWIQDSDGKLLGRPYTWTQAWNQLQSIQDIGARIQLTTSLEHTVQRVIELAEYYAQPYHNSVVRQTPGDPRLAALSQIHGVSFKTAQVIMAHFGTIEYIAVANEKRLTEITGIGPVLAQRIRQFFTEKLS